MLLLYSTCIFPDWANVRIQRKHYDPFYNIGMKQQRKHYDPFYNIGMKQQRKHYDPFYNIGMKQQRKHYDPFYNIGMKQQRIYFFQELGIWQDTTLQVLANVGHILILDQIS